jgi:hypothetical protein
MAGPARAGRPAYATGRERVRSIRREPSARKLAAWSTRSSLRHAAMAWALASLALPRLARRTCVGPPRRAQTAACLIPTAKMAIAASQAFVARRPSVRHAAPRANASRRFVSAEFAARAFVRDPADRAPSREARASASRSLRARRPCHPEHALRPTCRLAVRTERATALGPADSI